MPRITVSPACVGRCIASRRFLVAWAPRSLNVWRFACAVPARARMLVLPPRVDMTQYLSYRRDVCLCHSRGLVVAEQRLFLPRTSLYIRFLDVTLIKGNHGREGCQA